MQPYQQMVTHMIEDIPLVKTATTVGVAAIAVPNAVPATVTMPPPTGFFGHAMAYWWQMMSLVDVYNWKDASGYFGTWLAVLGIIFLVWRSVLKPLGQRFGLIKPSKKMKVEITESEYQQLRDMR